MKKFNKSKLEPYKSSEFVIGISKFEIQQMVKNVMFNERYYEFNLV